MFNVKRNKNSSEGEEEEEEGEEEKEKKVVVKWRKKASNPNGWLSIDLFNHGYLILNWLNSSRKNGWLVSGFVWEWKVRKGKRRRFWWWAIERILTVECVNMHQSLSLLSKWASPSAKVSHSSAMLRCFAIPQKEREKTASTNWKRLSD